MQILPACLLAAAAAIQLPSAAPIVRSDSVLVRAVIDGDTIDVATIGRVRLLGIDAPEIGRVFDTSAPFAREAKDRLSDLILRHWVRLEQEGPAIDAYDRRLAYVVREDGLFVNAVLVREGLARVSARLPLSRLAELQKAEQEAQSLRRGMWSTAPGTSASGYTSRAGSEGRSAARSKAPRASHGKKNKKPSSTP